MAIRCEVIHFEVIHFEVIHFEVIHCEATRCVLVDPIAVDPIAVDRTSLADRFAVEDRIWVAPIWAPIWVRIWALIWALIVVVVATQMARAVRNAESVFQHAARNEVVPVVAPDVAVRQVVQNEAVPVAVPAVFGGWVRTRWPADLGFAFQLRQASRVGRCDLARDEMRVRGARALTKVVLRPGFGLMVLIFGLDSARQIHLADVFDRCCFHREAFYHCRFLHRASDRWCFLTVT